MDRPADSLLEPVTEAIERGDWDDAYTRLMEADADGRLDRQTLPLLADAAYMTGHPDVTIRAWERTHRAALKDGDREGAALAGARVCFFLFEGGMFAEAQGWLRTVQRLIEGQPESRVHATISLIESWRLIFSGDIDSGLASARRTIELAERLDDQNLVAFARTAEARALMLQGHVEEGLSLFDDMAVTAVSGGFDPVTTGAVFCAALCAFQAMADYERADVWTAAMQRWNGEHMLGSFPGRCRVHRAEILRARGAHAEAEVEALRACEEFAVYVPGDRGWPLAELGQIRLRLGDLAGADEAFLEAYELGWEPQPGLALLRLAQGDPQGAAAQIRAALDEPREDPSQELPPNTELRRAPRLAAQVEIALATDDLDRARWASGELAGIAHAFGTKPLRAAAAVARGSVELAEGSLDAARSSFQEGVSLWSQLNVPYETARARMGLAAAYGASDNREHRLLELKAARSTFERLGAKLDAVRAADAERAAGGARVSSTERRAFLFTDIVRSTPLIEAIGDEAWGDLVEWHDATLRGLFAAHGGEEMNQAGDGFFVAFEDAGVALHCAQAIQRSLVEHRREHGFAPQVRIGVHLDEATRRGKTLVGKGIHQAARISALAEGGEILVSRETLEAAGEAVGDAPVRSVSLKGISEPVDVVALPWR